MKKGIAYLISICFLITIFLAMPMVSAASAVEWDNVYTYNEDTATAQISNSFLRITELGKLTEVTRVTPQSNKIDWGECEGTGKIRKCKIGELAFKPTEAYNKPFGEMYTYLIDKDMQEIDLDYSFKIKEKLGEELIIDYEDVAYPTGELNSTGQVKFEFKKEKIGEHYMPVYNEAVEFDNSVMPNKESIIELYAYIEEGVHYELRPEIYGEVIIEWFDFVGFTKIEFYDDWNGDIGCNAPNVCGCIITLGATGTNGTYDIDAGISIDFTSTSGVNYIVLTNESSPLSNKPDFSQNLSVNTSISVASASTGFNISLENSPTTLSNQSTRYAFYMSGAGITPKRDNDGADAYPGGECFYGLPGALTVYADWYIPLELYGTLAVSDTPPAVSLNETPVDGANISRLDLPLTLFANATDDSGLLNVSLYLNGIFNSTTLNSTSGQLQLNHSIDLTLDLGTHNWSEYACDLLDQCTMTENKTFTIIDSSPVITLNNTPTEGQEILLTENVSLQVGGVDDVAMLNISLFIDGVLNKTVYNTSANQLELNVSDVLFLTFGNHNWSGVGCDDMDQCTTGTTKNFSMVDFTPAVSLNETPVDGANFSFNVISLKANATDDNAVMNVSLFIDGVRNFTQFNITANQKRLNASVILTFADGVYLWSAEACHITGSCNNTENKTFTIDTSNPEIGIVYPLNISYTINITDLNISLNDSSPQACWYSLNRGSNNTFTCGTNVTNLSSSEGSNTVIAYANDTSGNQNSSTLTWFQDSMFPSINYTTLTTLNNSNLTGNSIFINITFIEANTKNITFGLYSPTAIINETVLTGLNYIEVIDGSPSPSPNISGGYNLNGEYCGFPKYIREDGLFEMWYDCLIGPYNIYLISDGENDLTNSFSGSSATNPFGVYSGFSASGFANAFNFNTTHINFSGLADGNYLFNVTIYDDSNQRNNTGTRNVTIDGTFPQVNITFPEDQSTILDNIQQSNITVNINYTFIETNPNNCFYYNNTENVSLTCGDNISFGGLPYGNYEFIVYVNDTFGHLNSSSVNVTYGSYLIENSQTYNNMTVEGALEDFSANFTISPLIGIASATLIYNTSYSDSGSINSIGQQRILEVTNFQIPAFSVDTLASFYWSINLSDGTMVNSSTQIQNVSIIELDDCSVFAFNLFNISLFDEETITPLNGTIELFYEVQNKPDFTTIQNLSTIIVGVNNTMVCSGINLTGQDLGYSLEIKYYATEYAAEFYNIQKADIIEEITPIDLFDLQLNDTTEFSIIYENENVVKIPGAVVQLQRRYIGEDIWRTVEAPMTGEGGKAVVHIDLDTNKYRAIIVKDGIVLDIFENIVFECENELSGQCSQNLFALIDAQNSVSIEQLQDFAYTISETNGTITTIFSIPSGVPSTVNIQLSQTDQFGNTTLCNKTIISSSGSIECDYLTTIGESYLAFNIVKDGDLQASKTYIVPEDGGIDFLNNNFYIVLILLFSVVGMAFTSPEWIIVNGVMTMLIAGSLWLLNGLNFVMGLGGLMYLIIAAAILIRTIAKQEDK